MKRISACAVVILLAAASCAGRGDAPPTAAVVPADAGAPDASRGCPAGSAADDLGACAAAGVPESACAPGFVPDGARGCAAVLPAGDCPAGTFARPGETSCHEVAPCGDDPFPPVTRESAAWFVDARAASAAADGTRAHPFPTVDQAIAQATAGADIAIAAGTYAERIVVDKPLTLVGRCPRLVTLAEGPTSEDAPSLVVEADDLDAFTMRTLAVQFRTDGGAAAVSVVRGGGATFDRVWFRDGEALLSVATPITVVDSLFENTTEALNVSDAAGDVRGSVFRQSVPAVGLHSMIGVSGASAAAKASPALFSIRSSVFLGGPTAFTAASSMVAVVDASLFRYGGRDDGSAAITASDTSLEVTRSVFESVAGGVETLSTATSIETSTFRDTSSVAILASLAAADDPLRTLVVRASSIARTTARCAVVAADVPAVIDRLDVDDTRGHDTPTALCAWPFTGGRPQTLAVDGARFHGGAVGIVVQDVQAAVSRTLVAGATPDANGAFGDGIDAASYLADTTLALDASSVSGVARSGVAAFGASVDVRDTVLRDCPIDLDGESLGERVFAFRDLGGNVCGGANGDHACAVQSASLAPPPALVGNMP